MTNAVAVRPHGWNVARGIRWVRRAVPSALVLLIAALFVQPPVQAAAGIPAKADPLLYSRALAHPVTTFPVIVRETTPSSTAAEDLVRSLGGHVGRELRIVGGFSADVPGSAVPTLTSSPMIWRVWGDASVHVQSVNMGSYDSVGANTIWQKTINLPNAWAVTKGAGAGIALLDTGVVPMPDLQNHVVHVVDLTGEADAMDRFGHGTHMAGILVGDGTSSNGTWTGVAPPANLVSIKVAGMDGSTDVSVVMAGLQWAVTHETQYNIRVLNLSFGTDSKQSYS